jgi:ficolin
LVEVRFRIGGTGSFFTTGTKICDDLYKSGKTITGVYTINPDGLGAFSVPCDMETTPGRGWTIFQRRIDGSENFNRTWAEYKSGFGNLSGEFWFGLDKIHRLSANGQNLLRIDLDTFENGQLMQFMNPFLWEVKETLTF